MACKKVPSVFVADDGMTTTPATNNDANQLNADRFQWASWRSPTLVEAYMQNKANQENQLIYYTHITNFVDQNHWNRTNSP